MAGITYFVALPFDVADGSVVVGEPMECPSPVAAIERAHGHWKVLGHTCAVAFSRTGNAATGDFRDATVLRWGASPLTQKTKAVAGLRSAAASQKAGVIRDPPVNGAVPK